VTGSLEVVERALNGWRGDGPFVSLATEEADLFAWIDRLVLLAAPGFEVVQRRRVEQEHDLRRRLAGQNDGARMMSDGEIAVFIQHYERLIRHILSDMPAYADLTLRLDSRRQTKAPA